MKDKLWVGLGALALFLACPDPNANRPCDAQGNCASGFACDAASKTCVAIDEGPIGGGRTGGGGGSATGGGGGSATGGGGEVGGGAGGGGDTEDAGTGGGGGETGGGAGGGGNVDPGDGGLILTGGLTTLDETPVGGSMRVVNGGFEYLQPACAGSLCVYGGIKP